MSENENINELNSKAYDLRFERKYEEAIGIYDKLKKLDPENILKYDFIKAECLISLNRVDEGLKYFDETIGLEKLNELYTHPSTRNRINNHKLKFYFKWKAERLEELEKWEESIDCWATLSRLDNNRFGKTYKDKAMEYYGKLLERYPDNKEYLKKLLESLNDGYPTLSPPGLKYVEDAIKREPDYPTFYLWKAEILNQSYNDKERNDAYKEAIIKYTKAIELDPDNIQYYKDKIKCIKSVYEYEERNPHYDRLNDLEKVELCEEAIKCYNKLIELDPEDIDNYYNKTYFLEKLGRYEEAIKCYDKAIKLEENPDRHSTCKIEYFEKIGKYDEAIELLDELIEKNHYYTKDKAALLEKLERYKEAIEIYDKLMKTYDKVYYGYDKARCLEKMGKYEEAIEIYDTLILKDIENELKYNDYKNKDYCLEKLREYEEAKECYKELRVMIDNMDDAILNPSPYKHKAQCLEKLGKNKEAKEYWDKATKLEPKYDEYTLCID